MTKTNSSVVIVPDGLDYDFITHRTLPQVSFVYRAVFDWVQCELPNRTVYLAPGNHFGSGRYEQEAAADMLHDYAGTVVNIPSQGQAYIDTRGNAAQLRHYLVTQSQWPLPPIILVSSTLHRPRAAVCFTREGFTIAASIGVKYKIPDDATIVPRLWYYKYNIFHLIYETAAWLRDFCRPAVKG